MTPGQISTSSKTPAAEKRTESLLTPQIVRDIEKEIAQHTQDFDKAMLDKSSSKVSTSQTTSDSATKTGVTDSAADTVSKNTTVSAEVKLKQRKINLYTPIQAQHVIQLIRLLAIIAIAAITGILVHLYMYIVETKSYNCDYMYLYATIIIGYYAVIQHGSSISTTTLARDSLINANDSDGQRTDGLDQFLHASGGSATVSQSV